MVQVILVDGSGRRAQVVGGRSDRPNPPTRPRPSSKCNPTGARRQRSSTCRASSTRAPRRHLRPRPATTTSTADATKGQRRAASSRCAPASCRRDRGRRATSDRSGVPCCRCRPRWSPRSRAIPSSPDVRSGMDRSVARRHPERRARTPLRALPRCAGAMGERRRYPRDRRRTRRRSEDTDPRRPRGWRGASHDSRRSRRVEVQRRSALVLAAHEGRRRCRRRALRPRRDVAPPARSMGGGAFSSESQRTIRALWERARDAGNLCSPARGVRAALAGRRGARKLSRTPIRAFVPRSASRRSRSLSTRFSWAPSHSRVRRRLGNPLSVLRTLPAFAAILFVALAVRRPHRKRRVWSAHAVSSSSMSVRGRPPVRGARYEVVLRSRAGVAGPHRRRADRRRAHRRPERRHDAAHPRSQRASISGDARAPVGNRRLGDERRAPSARRHRARRERQQPRPRQSHAVDSSSTSPPCTPTAARAARRRARDTSDASLPVRASPRPDGIIVLRSLVPDGFSDRRAVAARCRRAGANAAPSSRPPHRGRSLVGQHDAAVERAAGHAPYRDDDRRAAFVGRARGRLHARSRHPLPAGRGR